MQAHYFIVGLMVSAGLLGGLSNFLTDPNFGRERPWYLATAPFVLSLIAALTTPLFLSLAKSQIIENLISGYQTSRIFSADVFVFFGFCLVASLSSRVFLERLTDQVLALKKDVSETRREMVEIAEEQAALEANLSPETKEAVLSELESEPVSEPSSDSSGVVVTPPANDLKKMRLTPRGYKILMALEDSRFRWRTISALSKETEIEREILSDHLERLLRLGLVGIQVGTKGSTLYSITEFGRLQLHR